MNYADQTGWTYDTHVHLADPEYGPAMGGTLRGMRRMRVRACAVSTGAADSERTLGLAGAAGGLVLPFVGIHPERAGSEDPAEIEALVDGDPGAVAGIGEIGLDASYCGGDARGGGAERQRRAFGSMMALAERHGKPVSIHARGSLGEVLDASGSYSVGGACLHWFDGNKGQLRAAMDGGFFVSYGPLAVYAGDKRGLMARTDRDRILVETDGPVRFGGCFGRRPAQAGFVHSVVLAAALALRIAPGEARDLLEANSRRFLGI